MSEGTEREDDRHRQVRQVEIEAEGWIKEAMPAILHVFADLLVRQEAHIVVGMSIGVRAGKVAEAFARANTARRVHDISGYRRAIREIICYGLGAIVEIGEDRMVPPGYDEWTFNRDRSRIGQTPVGRAMFGPEADTLGSILFDPGVPFGSRIDDPMSWRWDRNQRTDSAPSTHPLTPDRVSISYDDLKIEGGMPEPIRCGYSRGNLVCIAGAGHGRFREYPSGHHLVNRMTGAAERVVSGDDHDEASD